MSLFSKGSFHIAHFVLFVSGDKRDLDWYLKKILVYQRRLLTPSFMSDIFPIVPNVDGVHREILKNARVTRECASGVKKRACNGVRVGTAGRGAYWSSDVCALLLDCQWRLSRPGRARGSTQTLECRRLVSRVTVSV